MSSCHSAPADPAPAPSTGQARIALIGSPNAGKTTLFNALTGSRARTGNYPGVTVSRREGEITIPGGGAVVVLEDLPGTYSLDPISPDERIVTQVLDPAAPAPATPDAILAVLDATQLPRSLTLLAHAIQTGLPTAVALTFADDLVRRGGAVDGDALARALGLPVVPATAGRTGEVDAVRARLGEYLGWERPPIPPPTDPGDVRAWTDSVLRAAGYRAPDPDGRTARIDAVLLHPVWGTALFFAVMFAFFQTIFTLAAPLQDALEGMFASAGELARAAIGIDWLAAFVAEALIGGIGGVLVFLPQIALLFLLVAILEGTGYLARAAFLMDRVMATAGLEGRSFVALLSSVACAVPGVMATRSLPNAKDRIATMMGAPLMTCSARLPVYVLLIGMVVPSGARWGPVGLQGLIMFALYLLGAAAAMTAAWLTRRTIGRRGPAMPFYLELPSYQRPRVRTVAAAVGEACRAFLRKVGGIILITTSLLWAALNLPAYTDADLAAAGVDTGDPAAVSAYQVEHSLAARAGRAVEPVFEPLGFDWRIDVGIMSAFAAREVFVATLGQIGAAQDPSDPAAALSAMTVQEGPHAGEPLFSPGTTAALLVFFALALLCMATMGALRRESGTWRWPLIAFGGYFGAAWLLAWLARLAVEALV